MDTRNGVTYRWLSRNREKATKPDAPMGGMAQEANALGNAKDMLTWVGCSGRQGLSICQGFRHTVFTVVKAGLPLGNPA